MSEPVTIRCRENGPLVVTGAVRVVDHLGNEFTLDAAKGNVALCRCGTSQKRPFCDGSHKACHFVAADLAVKPQ